MFKKPLLFSLFFAFSSLFPPLASALSLADSFKLNREDSVASVFPSISSIISTILPNLFILSGIVLLFIFLGAGFTIISGGDNPEKTQKGKQAITGAIIGFIIIFTSYWIIQIIEVITGIPILDTTRINYIIILSKTFNP